MADNLSTRENELAEKLKLCCVKEGEKWKENEENIAKSAILLHQMGELYFAKSRTDAGIESKLNLIRCVTLLNAAVTRQPDNEVFKSNLSKVCSSALIHANAADRTANLVEIAKDVATKVHEMREKAREMVTTVELDVHHDQVVFTSEVNKNKIEKESRSHKETEIAEIKCMQKVQEDITTRYKDIMKFIAAQCEEVMGSPLCRYCVIGMGSLARKEITPYSDFEHVIVLEDGVQERADNEQILEYFRWFAVIFQVVVINLGETIIPAVAIPSLNDFSMLGGDWFFDVYSKRGVSFDGFMPKACKSPLGRTQTTDRGTFTTELIRPVSKMVEFVHPKTKEEDEYNVADILTKVCFVAGSVEVFEEFRDGVKLCLAENRKYRDINLLTQIRKDVNKFDVIRDLLNLLGADRANIKRILYRSLTLFISALGQLHQIEEYSCFDVITALRQKNVISDATAHRLLYASAVACFARLKVYQNHSKQHDEVISGKRYYISTENDLPCQLADIIGEQRLVLYLVTAYDLQVAMKCQEVTDRLNHYLQENRRSRFKVLRYANLYERLLQEWSQLKEHLPLISSDDEMWIRFYVAGAHRRNREYRQGLEELRWFDGKDIKDPLLHANLIVTKVKCLYNTKQWLETVKWSQKAKQFIEEHDLPCSEKHDLLCWCLCYLGILSYLEPVPTREPRIMTCELNIANCLMMARCYSKAVEHSNKVLDNLLLSKGPLKQIRMIHHILAVCLKEQRLHDEALVHFKAELEIRLKYVPSDQHLTDQDIKAVEENIAEIERSLKPPA
ncbi:unnamed protein product [Clavelina lepadiformis]|uniref:Protein-PII uridylyltransferase N-terminal domain-containing protein n=1 Tax=Clavelina lepadiformis TaxID=159417 RepID=A0ABP0GX57_CLALP